MPPMLCPVLVGRDEELDVLGAAWTTAATTGGMVFITGEPGIGKSRLIREIAAWAGPTGIVGTGRGVPTGFGEPFRPFVEALQQILRDRPVLDAPELAPWLPILSTILPACGPATGATVASWVTTAARGEAIVHLLRHLGDRVLLALDDLQWADPDTIALVEYLADNLASSTVLCVVGARNDPPSAISDLVTRLCARRVGNYLPLSRLGADDVARMVRACIDDADAETVSRVQLAADGVPFLIEESLVTPGVPSVFADSVRARLRELRNDERNILEAAALLGRRFDWRLLSPVTSRSPDAVAAALRHGVDLQLLEVDDAGFAFRHALTRDAVLADVLPPDRAELAAHALDALAATCPEPSGADADLAAALAREAGDTSRAGNLLLAVGRAALERGALPTAIDTLRRASELLASPDARAAADHLQLEALALAGRLDEALAVGERVISLGRPTGPDGATACARAHLTLTQTAVAATQWSLARRHLDLATSMLDGRSPVVLQARRSVLEAELVLVSGDLEQATMLAEGACSADATDTVRCHALELLGRIARGSDLERARTLFEEALATADRAGLIVARLRALHELGTIDMFDHAGTERLARARAEADRLGAGSTAAVVELQLAATYLFRFDAAAALSHGQAALELARRLELDKIRATALLFLGEAHALRRDHTEARRHAALAEAAAPGDPEIVGSTHAGVDGILALLDDDASGAVEHTGRGAAILERITTGPAHYLGLLPLLLASGDDPTAEASVRRARERGLEVNRINRGFLGYARAILAGRAGAPNAASDLSVEADRDLRLYPVWSDIARLLACDAAIADRWGRPHAWLALAEGVFQHHDLTALAARCRQTRTREPSRLEQLGITGREADVLRLVAEGHTNREIAGQLFLSVRTVEKHVEALLRKTNARTRTQLVPFAPNGAAP